MHPGPYTLRELLVMEDARLGDQWNHTSFLVAEVLSSCSTKPISPAAINPYLAMKRATKAPKNAKPEKKLKAMDLAKLLGAKPLKKKE